MGAGGGAGTKRSVCGLNRSDVEQKLNTTFKVCLNGRLVSACIAKQGLVLDENMVRVTLNKGENRILVKTSNQRGEWKISLRLTAPGSKTLAGVEF